MATSLPLTTLAQVVTLGALATWPWCRWASLRSVTSRPGFPGRSGSRSGPSNRLRILATAGRRTTSHPQRKETHMGAAIVATVDTMIEPEHEQDLINGFHQMTAGPRPEGLLRSELLRGQGKAWRIQTTWRDRDSLLVQRATGEPPAALALLERLGAPHSHSVYTVELSIEA